MYTGAPHSFWAWPAKFASAVFTLASLATLVGWHETCGRILQARPPSYALQSLRLEKPGLGGPGQTVIGRKELLQPPGPDSAETSHIRIHWDPEGWKVSSAAVHRRLALVYMKDGVRRTFDAARWPLPPSGRIVVEVPTWRGAATLAFEGERGRLALALSPPSAAGTQPVRFETSWDGARATVTAASGQAVLPLCGSGSSALASAVRRVNAVNRRLRAALGIDSETAAVFLGGNITCSDGLEPVRIAIPGVPAETFAIYASGGALYVGPGPDPGGSGRPLARAAAVTDEQGVQRPFANLAHGITDPVRGQLVGLIAGRTLYEVRTEEGRAIVLTPAQNTPWIWAAPGTGGSAPKLPPGAAQVHFAGEIQLSALWSALDSHGMAAAAFFTVLAVPAFPLLLRRRNNYDNEPFRLANLAGPLAAAFASGAAVLLLNLSTADFDALGYPTALLLVLIPWTFATLAVALACRGTWLAPAFWFTVTALAALGNIVLFQLGMGSDGSRWMGFYNRALAPLALFAALILLSLSVRRERWLMLSSIFASGPSLPFPLRAFRSRQGGRWLIRATPFALLAIMIALWLALGKEEGIEGIFQPSEFVKLGVLFLVSMALVSAYKNTVIAVDAEYRFVGVVAGFAAMFFVLLLFCVIPVLRHDFSPALIMGATAVILLAAGSLTASVNALWLVLRVLSRGRRREYELDGLRPIPLKRQLPAWLGAGARLSWRRRLTSLVETGGRWIVVWICLGAAGTGIAVHALVSGELSAPGAMARFDARRGEEMFGTLYDRVLSYLDLHLDRERPILINYPDEGRQVRFSREVIATAPCTVPFPEGTLFERLRVTLEALLPAPCPPQFSAAGPELAFGQPNPPALMRVPLVQNDFIGSFVIGRFGLSLAAAMILLQLAAAGFCWAAAVNIYRWHTGFEEDRARCHFLALLSAGAGVLLTLQWGLSWSNVFGTLPVAGQPMTLVASAGSHVSAFAAPLVALVLITMRCSGDVRGIIEGSEPPPEPSAFWRRFLPGIASPALRYNVT